MKLVHCALAFAGAISIAAPAHAQQPYGPWVHDNTQALLAIYVSPSGSTSNTGLSPSSPLPTLFDGVAAADYYLSLFWPLTGKGITINVDSGTYTQQQPLSVPAFGISIEPYRDVAAGSVIVNGAVGPNVGIIQYDTPLGPACSSAIGTPAGMPPSILRGISVRGNTSGFSVLIDPTANPTSDRFSETVAVAINECELDTSSRGVRIQNTGGLQITYACEIVDNDIHNCALGVDTISVWDESNLFRSNRIYDCHTGMRLTTQSPKSGRVRPRILSNAIWNMDDQFGIEMQGVSAQIVGNTIAFVTGPVTLPLPVPAPNNLPASVVWFPGSLGGAGETLVFANNILFSPPFAVTGGTFDPREIEFGGTFGGALTLLSNDFDASGTLTTPALLVSATNVPIASPLFASMTTPRNVHLTAASPSVTNLGDMTFTVPGGTASFVINGTTFLANCALDMDLDARTHQTNSSASAVLHRGADQFVADGIRLSAPTTSGTFPAHELADAYGSIRPNPSTGISKVLLEVAAPNGSYAITVLCSTLPMTPELEHVGVAPYGNLAIDPGASNAVVIDSAAIGSTPRQFLFNFGTVIPSFLEAEMYLQTLVFRPNGTATFSNRIRLELDQN